MLILSSKWTQAAPDICAFAVDGTAAMCAAVAKRQNLFSLVPFGMKKKHDEEEVEERTSFMLFFGERASNCMVAAVNRTKFCWMWDSNGPVTVAWHCVCPWNNYYCLALSPCSIFQRLLCSSRKWMCLDVFGVCFGDWFNNFYQFNFNHQETTQ